MRNFVYSENSSNFILLKKIFYIVIFTFTITSGAFSQGKPSVSLDQSSKYIHFYPNPAVTTINFEFDKGYDRSSSFQIYNFIGKKVYDAKAVSSKINVILTDFNRGVYIYQLRDKSGQIIESGKFQVIK